MAAASLTRRRCPSFLILRSFRPKARLSYTRHVRVERVALEHHRDVAVLRRHVVDHAVADEEAPVADLLEPGDAAQRGRLAAARRSDEDEELAVLDLEIQVVDGDDVLAVALVHVVERDGRHRVTRSIRQRQAAGGLVAHARERIIVRLRNPASHAALMPCNAFFPPSRRSVGRLAGLLIVLALVGRVRDAVAAPAGRAAGRSAAERSATCSRRCYDRYPGARPRRGAGSGCEASRSIAIVGTMRHPSQNTADFLPLPKLRGANWRGRWQRITRAMDRLETLPPVDLVQVGDDYYVADGHNRVAAARRAGGARDRRGRHPARAARRHAARPGEARCQLADRYRRGAPGGSGRRPRTVEQRSAIEDVLAARPPRRQPGDHR